jgi:hypothetical protein
VANVKIQLVNSTTSTIVTLKDNIPSDGSEIIILPQNLTYANLYSIRVTHADDSLVFGQSNDFLAIGVFTKLATC